MKKPRLLVVGSSNLDLIVRVDHIPRPGETVLGHDYINVPGGKGANQAVGAARAGGEVTFVARVGNDVFGEQAISGFVRDRVDVKFIQRDRNYPTGVAMIFVAANGENSIAVASGANAQLSPSDINKSRVAFANADLLLVQLETPLKTVMAAVRLAAQNKVPVVLDPAPAQPLPKNLLRQIAVLTPNESEAEALTGIRVRDRSSATRAARKLRSHGVPTVIITLGAQGALVCNGTGETFVPGFKVKAIDTTAAGDVFNGALAVALAEGESLVPAVRFACAAAAISVTRLGAQPSAPTRREIERLLKQRN